LEALNDNRTCILITLPTGKKAIGSKWVFKIKYKVDGSIERHKASLVAKGYNQIESVDYMEIFSPMAKVTTIRLVLMLAVANNCFLN